MNKLLVICGPTATGKTSLGIKFARKFNGEIVSADSRQVYQYMNIGTGKDLNKFSIFNFQFSIKDKFQIGYYLINNCKLWLLDVVEPNYQFSVADYVKCASLVLEHIWQRKKLPILVGGTGFYIKALVDGIETIGVPPDWELRKILRYKDIKILGEKLRKLDPGKWEKMNESDRRNPRRLVRTIEIAQSRSFKTINHKPLTINHLFIGLTAPYKVLYQRIDERVEERIKEGVVNEIKGLLKKGYSWENSVLGETIGYKEFKLFFEGKEDFSGAVQRWKYDEHGYARRQMTWFKKALRQACPEFNQRAQGIWFDITKIGFEKEIEQKAQSWLKI